MNSRKPANNYNTTSWSGYCPNSTVREDGQQAHDGRGVDRRRGRRCALWIMAALERSCEPDVPACQQQLCIIGCLPHVNACLLSPFARTVHPLQHCSLSLSLSLSLRFCSDSTALPFTADPSPPPSRLMVRYTSSFIIISSDGQMNPR